jgi:hypothetical protein
VDETLGREILREVTALREEVRRLAEAMRAPAELAPNPRAEMVCAIARAVGGREFTSADLLKHAETHEAELLAAILAACPEANPRRLGKLLRRLAGQDLEGFRVVCLATEAAGLIWRVEPVGL